MRGGETMAAGTDFLLLYKELRLRPGCGLDELRQAYRRRVAELHPDRVQHHLYEDAAARLSTLNAMYTSAMEFHKQHGRLPGEASVYRPDPAPRPQTPPPPAQSAEQPKRSSWILTLLLVLAALVIGWILGAVERDSGEDQSSAKPAVPQVAFVVDTETGPAPAPKVVRIRVGMDSDRVVEIEGQPVTTTKDRWEYGPSWIAFHCGEVLDWYSSPLRPLKVESMQAPADEVEKESRLRIPGCLKAGQPDNS
jgi:hypothetical protein